MKKIARIQVLRHYDTIGQFSDSMVDDPARRDSFGEDWLFVGVVAHAHIEVGTENIVQIVPIRSGGLWSVESDSDDSYFQQIGDEELSDLRGLLHEFGFTDEEIDAVSVDRPDEVKAPVEQFVMLDRV